MKKFEVEKNPEVVGEKMKKVLSDELEGELKKNTLCKNCKR